MNTRHVQHPRLNWLARWVGAVIFAVCAFDFVAADWIGYCTGPGVACPLVYNLGGRQISLGWFSEYRTNPKNSWFHAPYVHKLSPFERQYWKWQWWPAASLGNSTNVLPFIMIPTWMIVVACAAVSGVSWRWWWRDRSHRRGGCTACGYSRDGLAIGAVCPECGVAPKP